MSNPSSKLTATATRRLRISSNVRHAASLPDGFATLDTPDRQQRIAGMRKRASAAVSHSELTTVPRCNDDDSRTSGRLHLHDNRTRIVPGRTIGLCLRIRRSGLGHLGEMDGGRRRGGRRWCLRKGARLRARARPSPNPTRFSVSGFKSPSKTIGYSSITSRNRPDSTLTDRSDWDATSTVQQEKRGIMNVE
jgi:hypothetical protein